MWPTWIVIGLAWLAARLPLGAIREIGHTVGFILFYVAKSRRHIAEVNLAHCFPELDETTRRRRVLAVFREVATGAIELMIPWLNPKRQINHRFTVAGLEHLRAAQAQGRGVLLVGGHYSTMDVISAPLSSITDLDVMYRFNKNPAWERLQVNGRKRYFKAVIERKDTRQTLQRLKQGHTLWYAADQDYGPKHSVFAPFFGVQAATITATCRLAKFNQSPVLLMTQHRDTEKMTWHIEFSPIVENFPTGDDVADATRMNALLESEILKKPNQYLWIHRRFKTRPEGEASLY